MAKYTEFYKGRRKRRNYVFIPAAILIGLLAFAVVMFYGVQKYAVITKDAVNVKLPGMDEEETIIDEQGNEVKVFDQVDAQIVFEDPDYSDIQATAGENVGPIRAIFVPAEEINKEKLEEYAARLNQGNALVLEMKPRSGRLMWTTNSSVAQNYSLNTTNTVDVASLIAGLRELKPDIYLAAQISCCLDELFASFSTTVTLKNSYGADYRDDNGTWLDAYNTNLRTYIVELCRELYAMGFDEVILADVAHPIIPEPEAGQEKQQLTYTRDMSTTPSPMNAVCGFAISVADQLSDRDGLLSIYCDSAYALVRTYEANGQNAPLFMKLYDRVYLRTDKYAYSYNMTDIQPSVTIGEAKFRFVPVVENYLPENSAEVSWVLIDTEDD